MHEHDRRMIERQVRKQRAEEAIEALPPIAASAAWLKPFCYRELARWPYTAPYTACGYTWAITTAILLRMPINPDVPVYEPGCGHENEYLAELLQQRPQASRGIERHWFDAFREVAMRGSQLPIEGVHLSAASVELLNRLPGLMVETEPQAFEQHNFLSFRFDGGEGIVMKLHRPEPRRQQRGLDDEVPF